MGFRLVKKSVTLNDLERYKSVISSNSTAFGAHDIKVVDQPTTDSLPRNVIKYTSHQLSMMDALCSSW